MVGMVSTGGVISHRMHPGDPACTGFGRFDNQQRRMVDSYIERVTQQPRKRVRGLGAGNRPPGRYLERRSNRDGWEIG